MTKIWFTTPTGEAKAKVWPSGERTAEVVPVTDAGDLGGFGGTFRVREEMVGSENNTVFRRSKTNLSEEPVINLATQGLFPWTMLPFPDGKDLLVTAGPASEVCPCLRPSQLTTPKNWAKSPVPLRTLRGTNPASLSSPAAPSTMSLTSGSTPSPTAPCTRLLSVQARTLLPCPIPPEKAFTSSPAGNPVC